MATNKVELSFASVVTMANQRAGEKRGFRHPWFGAANLAAFNTKIPHAYLLNADERIVNMKNDIIFVSADDTHDHSTQRFTVRLLDGEGNITNISEFQEFTTVHRALKKMTEYAEAYGSDLQASAE